MFLGKKVKNIYTGEKLKPEVLFTKIPFLEAFSNSANPIAAPEFFMI